MAELFLKDEAQYEAVEFKRTQTKKQFFHKEKCELARLLIYFLLDDVLQRDKGCLVEEDVRVVDQGL